jgi:NAD-dependent deacetylase
MKQNLVILSGAGISAESGLATFRNTGGLWEGYNVMEVASIEGWQKNPSLVLDFYNMRRRQAKLALPNKAHKCIADLETHFQVKIITQNVDNLHEQAGSSNVLHLHGELFKSRSTLNLKLVYDMKGTELNVGDTCDLGSQLRPHIVWFGESDPLINTAANIITKADILIIIGTSLQVYPAAGLIEYIPSNCKVYLIDLEMPSIHLRNLLFIQAKASEGMPKVYNELLKMKKTE